MRLIAFGFLVLLASISAFAEADKPARIGVVFYTVPLRDTAGAVPANPIARAFVEGLREKGWVDGRNAHIAWRSAQGEYQRLPALVEELVRMPVDILVASGDDIALESIKRSPALPVVMASADDPIGRGLIASLARPGGSITGVGNWVGRNLNAKRLALLKEAVPGVTRVAVLAPLAGIERGFLPETAAAARSLGISIFGIGADRFADLEPAFEAALRSGANGIFVTDYPLAFAKTNQVRISELAVKHRLPAIHSASTAADEGALLTYGADISGNYRRAGHLVDKILRGAKPGDIPFEEPAKMELVVNLKAAKAIGLTIPTSVLIQASRTID